MKLIVQIPCLNEEPTLPLTLRDIPRKIPGVDSVEVLVIDDGSTDRTAEVAREWGADHVLRLTHTRGLAAGFAAGLEAAVTLGADIVVNTDGDNQYCGADIPGLIAPILDGRADMVIGTRPIDQIREFSPLKKKLQRWGSWVVRRLAGTEVADVTSGFRAFSREAALRLTVLSEFTYTLETIIQAGKKNLVIATVPVRTNQKLRESRLFQSIPLYLARSAGTIMRIYTLYSPLKVFTLVGGGTFGAGLLLGLRFLYYYVTSGGMGHIQSLILAAVLLLVGFQLAMIGLVADIIAANRRLLEDTLYRVRRLELNRQSEWHAAVHQPKAPAIRRGDGTLQP